MIRVARALAALVEPWVDDMRVRQSRHEMTTYNELRKPSTMPN